MTDLSNTVPRVPKRVAAVILNSLKGGVVPRIGLPYITVGRETEIRALLTDLSLIADGGASFRFLVGRYGAGKSFLLQTIRTHAMGEGFVVADADLSPERRLQGGQGQGLATYRELIRNLSTKTRPEGGALNLILDRWVASTLDIRASEDTGDDDESQMRAQLDELEEMVHGFDFARMLVRYRTAALEGDDEVKSCVARWLRGEYRTKTEAKADLGTSTIITDDDWYDYVKAHHLGIIMGGTPTSIEDRRRGVFSYEALRSRLTQGRFAREDMRDMLAPIIRLHPLTYEELLVLIEKLGQIHAGYFGYEDTITDKDLAAFLQIEFGRVGADTHLTPREVIRDFIELLDIAYQNPDVDIAALLRDEGAIAGAGTPAASSNTGDSGNGDAGAAPFAEFTL